MTESHIRTCVLSYMYVQLFYNNGVNYHTIVICGYCIIALYSMIPTHHHNMKIDLQLHLTEHTDHSMFYDWIPPHEDLQSITTLPTCEVPLAVSCTAKYHQSLFLLILSGYIDMLCLSILCS